MIANVEDPRMLARKRVPRMFYEYVDSGSWTQGTYRANESDLQSIKLRQRVAVNMENRSTRSTMVGIDVAMPVALAPTGMTGMQRSNANHARRIRPVGRSAQRHNGRRPKAGGQLRS